MSSISLGIVRVSRQLRRSYCVTGFLYADRSVGLYAFLVICLSVCLWFAHQFECCCSLPDTLVVAVTPLSVCRSVRMVIYVCLHVCMPLHSPVCGCTNELIILLMVSSVTGCCYGSLEPHVRCNMCITSFACVRVCVRVCVIVFACLFVFL